MVDPSVPVVPAAPSVEELLVVLAQCDALIAVLAGRVAGRLHWIHVTCNDTWTLLHPGRKRGRVAMDAAGVLPDFRGIAIHDGLGRVSVVML